MDFTRLTVTDVSRYFGRRRALSHVSLTAVAGETIGLLGPNGAGKSTLLGVLATLIRPSRGAVVYGGHTADDGGPGLRARIGLLSHDLQIYAELTARENLEFFGALYGVDDRTARVRLALQRAGLVERGDDLVAGFSRGMRQRLALERALLHQPRLVLLDEPFTGLDEGSAAGLRDRLRQLRLDGGIVLVATHDLDAVDGLLDRVVVVQGGRCRELEPSLQPLRTRYRAALEGNGGAG